MKRYEGLFLGMLFLFAVLFESILSTGQAVTAVEDSVIRLHVLANSDEEEDQALKLLVRDRLLEEGEALFSGTSSREEARKLILNNLPKLQNAARETVAAEGYHYPVAVSLENCGFETRRYDGFSLPRGEYLSLRVVIGAGEGRNWWCVLYPPLCFSAAGKEMLFADLSAEEQELLERTEKFEVRLWLVDKLRKIFTR